MYYFFSRKTIARGSGKRERTMSACQDPCHLVPPGRQGHTNIEMGCPRASVGPVLLCSCFHSLRMGSCLAPVCRGLRHEHLAGLGKSKSFFFLQGLIGLASHGLAGALVCSRGKWSSQLGTCFLSWDNAVDGLESDGPEFMS